jgi:coenzyme PQQ biosynthesis protein PqqD
VSDPRYRLARGMRLKHEANGDVLLLVPEGIVELSETAVCVLELLGDGKSVGEVVVELGQRFDDPTQTLANDVHSLLEELSAAGFVEQ